MTTSQYLDRSARLSISLTFILPLLVCYEIGILLVGSGENGVALHLFKEPLLGLLGSDGMLAFNALVAALFLGAFAIADDECDGCDGWFDLYLGMIVESAAFAAGLGAAVLLIVGLCQDMAMLLPLHARTGTLIPPAAAASLAPKAAPLLLSIGAGVYEELFFRGILLTLLLVGTRSLLVGLMGERHLADASNAAALLAIVVSSLLFSLAHYIGPAGDVFQWSTFTFRYFCGVLLALIFLFRGLGIAVYTHAFYDIFLHLQ